MRSNNTSKAQAIRLIQAARAAGFSRKVEVQSVCGRRFAVMVVLNAEHRDGGLCAWAQIIVSFRFAGDYRRSRDSVTVSSITDYNQNSKRGLWDAQYALNYVRQYTQRSTNPISQSA